MAGVWDKVKAFVKGEEPILGLFYVEWGITVGLFVLVFVLFPYVFNFLEKKGLLLGAIVPLIIGILLLRSLLIICIESREKKIAREIEDDARRFILQGLPVILPQLAEDQVHQVFREFDTMMAFRAKGQNEQEAYLKQLGERQDASAQPSVEPEGPISQSGNSSGDFSGIR
ncbi:MAG: hypothetical protein KKB20_14860 [Proteobacteria bacterium]|nr:hypothetical protein [Pseudomonadota bacterium]